MTQERSQNDAGSHGIRTRGIPSSSLQLHRVRVSKRERESRCLTLTVFLWISSQRAERIARNNEKMRALNLPGDLLSVIVYCRAPAGKISSQSWLTAKEVKQGHLKFSL